MRSGSASLAPIGAFATGVVLALFGIWGGVGAITPSPTKAPAQMAVYDEP
ncbi:hypothetical protein [Nostocoides veronense]